MLKTVNGITFFSSPNLESFSGLVHAFLGRTGGVSSGHLASLNMGRREEDTPENLKENRRRVAEAFRIDQERVFTVSQVHSDRIIIIDNTVAAPEQFKGIEADGIITSVKGIAVGILTADCVPVLLYDKKNGVIAALHAGWRGTAMKIVEESVKTLQERFGTDPKEIVAAIGPAIGICCYKVNDDVVMAVGNIDKVTKPCEFHWCVDLSKANLLQLQEAGVVNIDVSNICTSCRTDIFFSHRREKGKTGRQLSFISLKP